MLHRELAARGFAGSAVIVRRAVAPLRQAVTPRATVRFETGPGEQAQLDFDQIWVWIGAERVAAQLLTQPKLLIIDEIGYIPIDRQGANLFFQLVSRRYERGAILLSIQSLGARGEVFAAREAQGRAGPNHAHAAHGGVSITGWAISDDHG